MIPNHWGNHIVLWFNESPRWANSTPFHKTVIFAVFALVFRRRKGSAESGAEDGTSRLEDVLNANTTLPVSGAPAGTIAGVLFDMDEQRYNLAPCSPPLSSFL